MMNAAKFTLAAIFAIGSGTIATAQTEIKPAEAAQHMGDSVHICDKILQAKYARTAKDEPAQLYMGSEQPNPALTIVISKYVLGKMKYDPEKKLVNKQVCVRGRITSFEGKPAIELQNPNDIEDMDEK